MIDTHRTDEKTRERREATHESEGARAETTREILSPTILYYALLLANSNTSIEKRHRFLPAATKLSVRSAESIRCLILEFVERIHS